MFELIDREPLIRTKGGLCLLDGVKGEIRFDDVHFSYPSRPDVMVLAGVSFNVPADSMAAFVGTSGNGKSTVLNLVQRFYDVSEGSISIDGFDLKEMDPSWLRRQMAFVQQEPVLFGASLFENVVYGRNARVLSSIQCASVESCEAELRQVCEQANAHGFISSFPDGFNTLVGERGIKLSGGQKQRVAIARAILCQPRVLLLDEATSALDGESERLVKEALDELMKGRTRLVVAHRLSTVRDADQIMIVDAGRILESGNHEELILRSARYQELVKHQLQ